MIPPEITLSGIIAYKESIILFACQETISKEAENCYFERSFETLQFVEIGVLSFLCVTGINTIPLGGDHKLNRNGIKKIG